MLFVVCSDIHFTLTPPVARSAEPDWLKAMERQFMQVVEVCNKNGCPLLVAGDIFDKWNPPVELINFVIDLFRSVNHEIYAIPGQHDLPQHRYDARWRSAYGTLVRARVIRDVVDPVHFDGWTLYAAPWNQPIPKPEKSRDLAILIGHRYVWADKHSYPGAPEEGEAANIAKEVQDYDLSFWGDNHKGFSRSPVFNCGSFFRRKSDEVNYAPRFYEVNDDGTVACHYLDDDDAVFLQPDRIKEIREDAADFGEFLAEIRSVESDSIDFRDELRRSAKTATPEVQGIITSLLENT